MDSSPHARLVAVLAVADNGVIGREGRLPWRLPADLARFKALTLGKPVLMGRRTFVSLGRPLPGRHNVVLTHDRDWHAPGATVVHTLPQALAAAGTAAELMVIGGAEVYRQCWPALDRIELTRVHARPAGDVLLEGVDWSGWREVRSEERAADERNQYDCTFLTLCRVAGPVQPLPSISAQRQQSSKEL